MRILVIEDDQPTVELVRESLSEAGYAVDIALTGEDGEEMAGLISYDGILLDVMLPGKNGLAVLRSWRDQNILTPVLLLTGMDHNSDVINGFNAGADDYLIKPFRLDMLYARVAALVRRSAWAAPPLLKAGDLVMDTVNHEVSYKGERVDLTASEYAILELLMRHPNITITRQMLEEHLRDASVDIQSNVLEAHVSNLRAHFPQPEIVGLIQTVRGVGYRIKTPGPSPSRYLQCSVIFLLCFLATLQFQLDWFNFIPGFEA